MPIAKAKKLLKLINKIYSLTITFKSKNSHAGNPGRNKVYDDFCIFKIYVLMYVLNIKNIKAIWELLEQNKDLRQLCGFEENLDRTTLNRRLNNIYKKI
ncbi:hypothetical protein COX27_01945 [Candidatus Kuenenbacteria bacterium CG23_combo_of_CG06-09_8_20_14_all_36_9]|uniref:Transposase InsH N-terminal domain-containing protein n=1 Tax=Candidatus Kuenenbacteria bacterium CG10_big_fil_rev_8_21_14_0_10_36_11 TaxID=1974618 RepID=A0A2M6WAQ8_9BACT|nr:MAG: hypothetical protein COX27_01945 [Candidatus Kuenenbacteria bacterium CG23_combo_of_CG06-09_8_20_14_all_36_9]PIT89844.1 MAG: hypothetical protein COU23_01705 [Candidatus Kuenenbacteria bacterium CG10_big_fil_rev_8_21_14_0_10_36_11]